ncbi:MAG: T9SS type A sorting domain-containing protein [Bacteroidota bacterium]
MRYFYLVFLLSTAVLSAQNVNFTVVQGHGSGIYTPGDTVYLYARAMSEFEVFGGWSFSPEVPEFVADPGEWRGAFIMPENDLIATASFDFIPEDFLQFEQVMTSSLVQPLYTAFQPNDLGTVFIFHGTNGGVAGWSDPDRGDNYDVVKDLYHAGYSIVIPESQESTEGQDLNGDGRIRWFSFPIDTTDNIDYRNLAIVIDSFARRGYLDRNRLFSVGMSSGGSFSAAFSVAFATQASAIYCASSQALVAETTNANLNWCLMPNDLVLEPGAAQNAFQNHQTLLDRGLCSDYFVNRPFPIYPELLQRASLDEATSAAAFQELVDNGFTDSDFILNAPVDDIAADLQASPENWPVLLSLELSQIGLVRNQLSIFYGEHNFFSNHNQRTIQFFNDACSLTSSEEPDRAASFHLELYPNPTADYVWLSNISGPYDWAIYDMAGRLLSQERSSSDYRIAIPFQPGLYVLKVYAEGQLFTECVLKR